MLIQPLHINTIMQAKNIQPKVSVTEVMTYIGAQYPETVNYIFTELAEQRVDFNNRQEVLEKSKQLFAELLVRW